MRKLLVFLAIAAATSGCSSFDHVAFSDVKGATDRADLANEGITLVEGYAVASTAIAIDDDGDEMRDLTLHSDEGAPLGVAPGPDEKTYVFYGRNVGQGQIRVRVDGEQVGVIPVTVVPQ